MTLYKWVREHVEKLTYINKVEFKGARVYLFYSTDGGEKVKVLPYRATRNQLLATLERIRQETNYYDKERRKREEGHYKVVDKDPIIVTNKEE